jgi:hypothetical protein
MKDGAGTMAIYDLHFPSEHSCASGRLPRWSSLNSNLMRMHEQQFLCQCLSISANTMKLAACNTALYTLRQRHSCPWVQLSTTKWRHGGMEVYSSTHSEPRHYMVSFMPWPLCPRERDRSTHWIGGQVRVRADLNETAKKNISAPTRNWTHILHFRA